VFTQVRPGFYTHCLHKGIGVPGGSSSWSGLW